MPLSMLTNLRIPEMKKNPYVNDQFEISGMTVTLKFSGSHPERSHSKGREKHLPSSNFLNASELLVTFSPKNHGGTRPTRRWPNHVFSYGLAPMRPNRCFSAVDSPPDQLQAPDTSHGCQRLLAGQHTCGTGTHVLDEARDVSFTVSVL